MDGTGTVATESGAGPVVGPVAETSDAAVVHLHGDIDVDIADLLEDSVTSSIEQGSDVVIDLADVTLINSACLAALVRAGRRAT